MAEYIDLEIAKRFFENIDAGRAGCSTLLTPTEFVEYLDEIEPAYVVPVKHGRWEWFEEWVPSTTEHPRECEDCGWRCGNCKQALEDMVGGYWDDPGEQPQIAYCPNCGSRMDGESCAQDNM